jgi:hypothetical protein
MRMLIAERVRVDRADEPAKEYCRYFEAAGRRPVDGASGVEDRRVW